MTEGEDSGEPLPCIRRGSLLPLATRHATPHDHHAFTAHLGHVVATTAADGSAVDYDAAATACKMHGGVGVATGAMHDSDVQPTQMQARSLLSCVLVYMPVWLDVFEVHVAFVGCSLA